MPKTVFKHVENHNSLEYPESLSKKVVRGGIWVFSIRALDRGLGFVRTVILARFLSPDDFGLMGIAILSISSLETFSQTGFQTALIQKSDNIDSYLDTAWVVSAIRGLILFLILFGTAPYVAGFFGSSQATWVIRTIAISTLLRGFKNIGIIFFQKNLEFYKQFVYELSGTLTDLVVAVSLALILKSVWALVWALLAANFCRLIVSYVVHPYRPKLNFKRKQFVELFGFGRWILGSSILTFLVVQGDDIFVGRFLGITALGLYQMAYLISNLPATEISHVISRITFPAFSKLQEKPERLREAYQKVLQVTVSISAPIAGGIFVLASDFISLFLGEKWMSMLPAVKLLVIAGFIRSIAATAVPVFHGVGKPKFDTIGQSIRLFLLAVLIYPLTRYWHLVGASTAVLGSILAATVCFAYWIVNITACGVKNYIRIVAVPLTNSILMVLSLVLVKTYLPSAGCFNFFVSVVFGIVIYVSVSCLTDKMIDYRFFETIKEITKLTDR